MENGPGRRINRILGGMQSKNVRIVCLIISFIFVILMFLPWLHLKIEIADASSTYSVECRFSMFELERTCLKAIDSIAGSFELFGMSAENIHEFVPLLRFITVFIALIHALIAFFVILFGGCCFVCTFAYKKGLGGPVTRRLETVQASAGYQDLFWDTYFC